MNAVDLRSTLHELRDYADAVDQHQPFAGDQLTFLRARRRLLARAVGPQVVARRARRRGWAFAAAPVTVALLTAVVAVAHVGGFLAGGATPAAAAALEGAADVTLSVPDPVVGANQYLKVTDTRRDLTVWFATDPHQVSARYFTTITTTRWIPGDPHREAVLELGCPSAPGPSDFVDQQSAQFVADQTAKYGPRQCAPKTLRGVGPSFGEPNVTSQWMAPDAAFLAHLPRDPQRLFKQVRDGTQARGDKTVDDQMWGRISDLLRTGLAPADLRAALFRTAALIPGVDVVADAVTLNGDTGVAIAHTTGNAQTRDELVFDPASGRVIGQRSVALEDGDAGPAGTVTETHTQTQQVVNTTP